MSSPLSSIDLQTPLATDQSSFGHPPIQAPSHIPPSCHACQRLQAPTSTPEADKRRHPDIQALPSSELPPAPTAPAQEVTRPSSQNENSPDPTHSRFASRRAARPVGEDERVGAPKARGGFGVELAVDKREEVSEWEERWGMWGGGCGSAGDEMQGLNEGGAGEGSIRVLAGLAVRANGRPDDEG
ncbi:hypothetical protein V500_10466 [Pseudogymnoascus sp. VKM F-4518 (FW-2643)]|nr:hypothetical protein V500_10466 [Pseudogymnoascus sp. VKM F-4518 (FW-2643)]